MTQLLAPPSGGGEGGGVADDDPRLSNARSPINHASRHADGGVDPVLLISEQITDLGDVIAAAILDLNLDTASTHPVEDFVLEAALTAAINSAIATWVGAAPEAFNTLLEIVNEMSANEDIVDALITTVGNKLAKASNLSDLTSAATARDNLGLGDIATQAISAFQLSDVPALGQPEANMTNLSVVKFLGMLNHVGPPVAGDLTSGNFPTGGQVIDSAGQEFTCLAGGNPGTWVALGSGKLIGGPTVLLTAFLMTTAATAEDVPGMSVSFVFDGRPVIIRLAPVNLRQDQAAAKLITLSLRRSTDNAVQTSTYRTTDTTASSAGTSPGFDTGPLTAWPSDSVAFVVGTTYTFKVNINSGASSKATFGTTGVPSVLYAVTA